MSTSPERVRLTADEAATVLRRAVELDGGDVAGPGAGELIEMAALEQAAVEVGLSPDALRRAVAELRAGALQPVSEAIVPTGSNRLVGPRLVAAQRVVSLAPADALDRAADVLRSQLFELRRDEEGRALWRKRNDIAASVQRVVDVTGRIKLTSVEAVTVTAVLVTSPVGGSGVPHGHRGTGSLPPPTSLVRGRSRPGQPATGRRSRGGGAYRVVVGRRIAAGAGHR